MQGASTAYQQCLERLHWAMGRLEIAIDPAQLVQIATLIVQPMMGRWRFFHTPQHIFEVGGEEDPIEVLAALFHDVVYVQVDLSIPFNLSFHLTPFIREQGDKLAIREEAELPEDRAFAAILAVFGFAPGQVLEPFAGQNEFLSAIVAAKALEPLLSLDRLLRVVVCIEATIPFRVQSSENMTPMDCLHERLVATNEKFDLGLTHRDIVEAVKRAVRVGNRDVIGFSGATAHFLANTWNLLPETNHSLIGSNSYTVRDYRMALQKMESFISNLQAESIFNRFEGEPNAQMYQFLEDKARKNLEVAKLYLASKVVTIALIEALSYGLGLNVPLATMMGIHPDRGSRGIRLESFITKVANPYRPKSDLEWQVLNFLEKGRKGRGRNEDYDLDNSPLATFLVKSLGFEEVRYQCDRAKGFFDRKISTKEFLAEFDLSTTKTVVNALASLFEAQKNAMNRCYATLASFANTQILAQNQTDGDRKNRSSTHNATV
ncbi:MAG: hypothetical protein WBB29_12165 [Geitlerinemataceae cyanobacterium]